MPTIISIIRAILVSRHVHPILFNVIPRTRIFNVIARTRIFEVNARGRMFDAIARNRIFNRPSD